MLEKPQVTPVTAWAVRNLQDIAVNLQLPRVQYFTKFSTAVDLSHGKDSKYAYCGLDKNSLAEVYR